MSFLTFSFRRAFWSKPFHGGWVFPETVTQRSTHRRLKYLSQPSPGSHTVSYPGHTGRVYTGSWESLGMLWRQADSGGKDQHSVEETHGECPGGGGGICGLWNSQTVSGWGRESLSGIRDQEEGPQRSLAGTRADKMRKISTHEVLQWGMRSLKALSWPGTSPLIYVAVVCMWATGLGAPVFLTIIYRPSYLISNFWKTLAPHPTPLGHRLSCTV